MFVVLPPDGPAILHTLPVTPERIREALEGYFDHLIGPRLPQGRLACFVDEVGHLMERPLNIAGAYAVGPFLGRISLIAGPIVVTAWDDESTALGEDEIRDLSHGAAKAIIGYHNQAVRDLTWLDSQDTDAVDLSPDMRALADFRDWCRSQQRPKMEIITDPDKVDRMLGLE